MKLRFPGIIMVPLLLFALLNIGIVSGQSKDDIRKFLNKLIDEEEDRTKMKVDRASILSRYTDDTKTSGYKTKDKKDIRWIDFAKLHLSLETESAVLGHTESCDRVHNVIYKPGGYEVISENNDYGFLYVHFKRISENKEEYCNFFAYLSCQDKPGTSGGHGNHECRCPSSMVWQVDRCVFKPGQTCRRHHGQPLQISLPPIWNFIKHKYSSEVAANCENPTHCLPGSDVCEVKGFSQYARVDQLAEFLKKRFVPFSNPSSPDPSEENWRMQVINEVLKDITEPYRLDYWYFLSLEFHMDTHLQEFGNNCDPSKDKPIAELMKNYHEESENSHFKNRYPGDEDNSYDRLRRQAQRKVLESGTGTICNHFKRLRCLDSRKCGCKDGLEPNAAGLCQIKQGSTCRSLTELKLFQLSAQMHTGRKLVPSYFHYRSLECQSGAMCKSMARSRKICLNEKDLADLLELQANFEKKFSIELEESCNVHDHEQLFETAKGVGYGLDSLADDKKTIEDLVAKTSLKYCRIRQHMACSRGGTCQCIPPAVPINEDKSACVIPAYHSCDAEDLLEGHKRLDQLILPMKTANAAETQSDYYCPSGVSCEKLDKKDYYTHEKYCLCSDRIVGDFCHQTPNKHLEHIGSIDQFPAHMRTVEGRQLIASLHSTLYKIENSMTLKYDDSCDTETNKKLDKILEDLENSKDHCYCGSYDSSSPRKCRKWKCNGHKIRKMSHSEWETFHAQLKDLVSKPFCNWNQGHRCVEKKCGCPENFYYEMGACHVELGGKCFLDVDEGSLSRSEAVKCRDGLECYAEDETDDNKCHESKEIKITNSREMKLKLIKDLRGQDKALEKLQTIEADKDCDFEKEKNFKETLKNFAILELAKNEQPSLADEKQMVRLLEDLKHEVDKLKSEKYCKVPLKCIKGTSKCGTDGDTGGPGGMTGTKKPYSKPQVSSSVRFRAWQHVKYYAIPALIFGLVQLPIQ